MQDRPTIVVLCGSTRFYDAFQKANYDLTLQGKIVLSVGFYPHSSDAAGHDSEQKVMLDELHLRKIDLADEVFVLNVRSSRCECCKRVYYGSRLAICVCGNKDVSKIQEFGYIGKSTANEIEYATKKGKKITYLVPPKDR